MHFISQFISEEIIYALGWTMVHSLWQGFLIAMVLSLMLNYYRENNAKLRYELSAFGMFTMLTTALATFLILYDKALSSTLSEIIVIASAGVSEGSNVFVSSGIVDQASSYFNSYLPLLVSVWLIGVVFFLIRLIGGLIFIQHLRRNNLYRVDQKWQDKLDDLIRKTPIRKTVELVESGLMKVPAVIGYLKPMILLPVGAINQMSDKEVEAVLSHELAHVLRNDYALNIFLSLIEVLFYYHPAIWWISSNVKKERENCCDDLAIKLCGDSISYARALVCIEEMNQGAPKYAMGFSGNKNALLDRIKRILNQPGTSNGINEKITAISMFFMAIIIMSFSSKSSLAKSIDYSDYPATLIEVLVETDVVPTNVFESTIRVVRDTVPKSKKKSKYSYSKTTDEGSVELKMENEVISELKIDGELIPESKYEDYSDLINEIRHGMVSAPVPPVPPVPPVAPTAPTAPVAPRAPGVAPAPPAPPTPPAPPAPPVRIKKYKSDNDNEGHSMIIIQGDDAHIIELGDSRSFIIDEDALRVGDSIIIIQKNLGHDDPLSVWPEALAIEIPNFEFYYDYDKNGLSDNFLLWQDQSEAASKALEKAREQMKKQMKKGHFEWQNEDWKSLWKERSEEFKHEFNEQQKQYQNLFKEKQLQRGQHLEEKEQNKELAEKLFFENNSKLKEQMEQLHEKLDLDRNKLNGFYELKNSDVNTTLKDELIKDNLIKEGEKIELKITSKSMKINGKKVPDALAEKYRALISELNGTEFKSDTYYQFKYF